MNEFDSYSNVKILGGFDTAGKMILQSTVPTFNSTAGGIADAALFDALLCVVILANTTVAPCSIYVQHSDDGSSWADVPEDLLVGRDPALVGTAGLVASTTSVENVLTRVQVLSKKRYFRFRGTGSGGYASFLGGGFYGFKPSHAPIAAQY